MAAEFDPVAVTFHPDGTPDVDALFSALADPARRRAVEILGKGQQFVAYAMHPDTGRPYEWVDLVGGLEALRAADLPVITTVQVQQALQVFEQMALEAGLRRVTGSTAKAGGHTAAPVDDPLMAYEPQVGLALADAVKELEHIDNEDYETWLKVGMALHHECQGDDTGFELWDDWSMDGATYPGTEGLRTQWDSFDRRVGSGHRQTTMASVIRQSHGRNVKFE